MSSRIPFAPENLEWKKAYMAAVLERDRTRLPGLIEVANKTLCERLRELLVSAPVPCDEASAIHDALYMLQALRSSLLYREDENGEWVRPDQDN